MQIAADPFLSRSIHKRRHPRANEPANDFDFANSEIAATSQ